MSSWIEMLDPVLRIVVATAAGTALGLNRDLHGKPTGVRTLGLVALSSALVTVAALNFVTSVDTLRSHVDAIMPVVQGVLTGIGFIGAGVILRSGEGSRVRGLTTAATVWSTAIIGLVSGLADWWLLLVGLVLIMLLLMFGGMLEKRVRLYFTPEQTPSDPRAAPPAP